MPHVTFVHVISDKPSAGGLTRVWCVALADATRGGTASMVYWAGAPR